MIAMTWKANIFYDYLRFIITCLDRAAFALLNNVFMLFFNVAESEFISGSFISSFFSRVQLLIGIFIMFQLAMTIIKGIVSPDTFTNDKTGGGNVIMRIVVSLVLLTLLVPISISSPKNEYERQINNKGILFGTLDSLQYRILHQHTLEKLIFGREYEATSGMASNNPTTRYNALKTFSNKMGSNMARTFYTVSLKETPRKDGKPRNPDDPDDRKCGNGLNAIYSKWKDENTSAVELLDLAIVTTCKYTGPETDNKNVEIYAFDFTMPVIPCIVGFAVVWLMLALTFEVGVRAVKLIFLRLIAPIPIISYMNPKGSKDGAFNAWLKLLGTTYIELFIKLAVIYFVLHIAESLTGVFLQGGLYADYFQNRQLGSFTQCVFIIALLIFAKDADKFIKQALGLKDNGGKFFSAIGQAMGIGATVASTPGNFMAGMRASRLADVTRKAYGENVDPNSAFNRAKHLLAGIAGGVTGIGVGTRATLTAKDHYASAAWDAMQKRNAAAIARGNEGSTLLGRMGSTFSSAITGEGTAAETERKINAIKTRVEHLKNAQAAAKNETVKQDWTRAAVAGFRDVHRASLDNVEFNLKQFNADLAKYDAMGGPTGRFRDFNGVDHEIDMSDAKKMQGLIEKFNQNDFMEQQYAYTQGTARADTKVNYEYLDQVRSAEVYGGSANFVRKPDGTIEQKGDKRITNRESVWDAIRDFTALTDQMKRSNEINKANDRHSGNDKK